MNRRYLLWCAGILPVALAIGVSHWGTAPVLPVNTVVSAQVDKTTTDKNRPSGPPLRSPPVVRTESDPLAEARDILTGDPEDSAGRIVALVDDLTRAGKFLVARSIADLLPVAPRTELYRTIFLRWGQQQPGEAVAQLGTVADPDLHRQALRSLADGWNRRDPGALTAYAINLAPGDDRDYALGQALDNWSLQDPAALGTWLNSLPAGPDFDAGVALMIAKTDGANRTPEQALLWVENIGDQSLRSAVLTRVLQEWQVQDPSAVRSYLAHADWLDETQRQKLQALIFTAPPYGAGSTR